MRGVKGSKVLRTRKIKRYESNYWYNYFCSQNCYDNFANEYIQQIIAIAPCTEAKETPIHDPTKERPYEHARWYQWEIKVDESRQID